MELDPQMLLVLLAVRMQGENASAKLDVFKKTLKASLAKAIERQLVKQEKIDVTVVNKKGKSTTKQEEVINLTEEGKKYLETQAGPEAQAASVIAQARQMQAQLQADREAQAAAALAQARQLQEQLQADRKTLRTEVQALISTKTKTADPSKEIKTLASKLEDVAKRFAKLEESMQSSSSDDLLARIDQAFAKLEQKLHARLGVPLNAEMTAPVPPTTALPSLRSVLRTAYETLCLYVEFEDGLVEIPRLYHEARKALPDLKVHSFHQELESLWTKRQLELKVLNEVSKASEPDKAIRHGDNVYYYVYWPTT